MANRITSTQSMKEQFSNGIIKLFQAYNIPLTQISTDANNHHYLVDDLECPKTLIEIKLYRSRKISLSLIENAISYLKSINQSHSAEHLVLIVSAYISDEWVSLASQKYGVLLWDLRDLMTLAEHIHYEDNPLTDLAKEIFPVPENKNERSSATFYHREPVIDNLWLHSPTKYCLLNTQSDELYNQLMNNPRTKSKWTKFESVVYEIIRYLYSKDLTGWYKNLKMESAYNRFELICRINSKHDFWNYMANNYNTRYVFFECKDVSELSAYKNVTAEELNALTHPIRSVGFIICRVPSTRDLRNPSQGAFYDNGRLLIHLTEADLHLLLTEKNNGNDPANLLQERLDNAITHLTL